MGIAQPRRPLADLQGAPEDLLDPLGRTALAHDDVDGVFAEPLQPLEISHGDEPSVHKEFLKTFAGGPTCDLAMESLARLDQRGQHADAALFAHHRLGLFQDGGEALLFDGKVALGAILRAEFGEEEPQEMVDLGDGGDGRFAAAAGHSLFDGDRRREPGDEIDIGALQLLDELPGVDGHAVEEPALALGKEDVKRERALARTAQAGDDDELIARNLQRDVLQIVLARAVNADGVERGGS